METQDAVDIARQALLNALAISAPVLLVGLLAGLVIGLLQALTQIQDQTVSFVPKLIIVVAALGFSLPWAIQRMTEYSHELITQIPHVIRGE